MFLASPTLFCTKGLLFPTLFLIGTNLRYPVYFSPTTVGTLIHVSSYPEAAVGWHQHYSYHGFNYTDFSGKKQKVKESDQTVYYPTLLYGYWWNTTIFPFTKKSYLQSRGVKILFLTFTCEGIGVAMVTKIRFCCYRIFLFFIRILTFWNRKYKYYCLYFSFITLYPSFITFLWQAFCDRWPL